jgi:hypothetical protein
VIVSSQVRHCVLTAATLLAPTTLSGSVQRARLDREVAGFATGHVAAYLRNAELGLDQSLPLCLCLDGAGTHRHDSSVLCGCDVVRLRLNTTPTLNHEELVCYCSLLRVRNSFSVNGIVEVYTSAFWWCRLRTVYSLPLGQ